MTLWTEPEVEVVIDDITELEAKTLSIESSLYASGCHFGMGC